MLLRISLINFFKKIELNQSVSFNISSKIWSFIAGPISALLIISYFSPELQGYYYTFSTLLALQVFIELGLGAVTQQFASHEWSNLLLGPNNEIEGDEKSLSRLISIAKISLKWFIYGGIISSFILIIGGYLFFYFSPDVGVEWELPWIFLCLATGIQIALTPIWSILEGCNQVKELYTFRFYIAILLAIVSWTSIALGAELWTGFIVSFAMITYSLFFIKKKYVNFFRILFFRKIEGPKINWKRDMLPMQWKIATSWISGYLCFYLFTPILFKFQGPIIAGQFGITWTLIRVVGSIGGAWLGPNVPKLAILVAKRRYKELDYLFWKLYRIIFIVLLISSLLAWGVIFIVNNLDFSITKLISVRLLSPLTVAILIFAAFMQNISTPFSAYMRAHKQEPGMHLSILQGILIASSTYIMAKYFSVTGVVLGYLGANIIVFPLVVSLWYRKRRFWIKNVY